MLKDEWKRHWGMKYDLSSKERDLRPALHELESAGLIGNVVIDIGSGAYPVSDFFTGKHKVVTIDLVGRGAVETKRHHLKYDIEDTSDATKFSTKKALVKVSRFLNVDPREKSVEHRADSIIFSEILNYVDCNNVITSVAKYLKVGGRIIIVNMPGRGFPSLFSEKGLKSNLKLYNLLQLLGFKIEKKMFPWRPKTSLRQDREFVILVARKLKNKNQKTEIK